LVSEQVPCSAIGWAPGKINSGHMDGGSISRPPILGGTNYDYWKARMMAFFKSMDSKTWKVIIKDWEHPVVMDKNGKATTTLKSEEEWSKDEDSLAIGNSRALNALFNGVDKNMFRLINTCTMTKDAWEILKLLLNVFLKCDKAPTSHY